MKAIWKWLGTPTTFRIASAAFLLALCLPVFIDTGNWWQTLKAVSLAASIWGLGYYSAAPEKGRP